MHKRMNGDGNALTRRGLLRGLGAVVAMPVLASAEQRPVQAAIAGVEPGSEAGPARTYKNPLNIEIGDPYVLREADGKSYYAYGTGGGEHGSKTAFPTFRSTDLVHWTPVGETYVRDPETSWTLDFLWAPEVYHLKNRYAMLYSAQWRYNPTNEKENFRIGVATADSPEGPFRDVRNEPLFDPGYPIIDADVLFDDDGRMYLYYSRCCYKHAVDSEIADWAKAKGWYQEVEESWIYGVELKPDFSGVIGEPVVILRPPVSFADYTAGWENRSLLSHAVNRRWTEGPCSLKHGGRYYVMYSANSVFGPEYALGYATAEHPLGPFTKALNNPVAQKNTQLGGDVTTTAHNCVTLSPDGTEMYCLYGARTGSTGKERVLFLNRMKIAEDGILTVQGPDDTDALPMPS
jgi:beta-xylosidase